MENIINELEAFFFAWEQKELLLKIQIETMIKLYKEKGDHIKAERLIMNRGPMVCRIIGEQYIGACE